MIDAWSWTPDWVSIAWDVTLCMVFYHCGVRHGRKQGPR